MNDDLRQLATRAVASKHWRWMPGMLMRDDREWARVYSLAHGDVWIVTWEDETDIMCSRDEPLSHPGSDWLIRTACKSALPDFSDPATRGCLLALVQEAHGALVWLAPETEPDPLDDLSYILTETPSWLVWIARDGDYIDVIGHGSTPAAALVAALEAAP